MFENLPVHDQPPELGRGRRLVATRVTMKSLKLSNQSASQLTPFARRRVVERGGRRSGRARGSRRCWCHRRDGCRRTAWSRRGHRWSRAFENGLARRPPRGRSRPTGARKRGRSRGQGEQSQRCGERCVAEAIGHRSHPFLEGRCGLSAGVRSPGFELRAAPSRRAVGSPVATCDASAPVHSGGTARDSHPTSLDHRPLNAEEHIPPASAKAAARIARRSSPPSSRGLGRRPLTAETGVRIPVAVLTER